MSTPIRDAVSRNHNLWPVERCVLCQRPAVDGVLCADHLGEE